MPGCPAGAVPRQAFTCATLAEAANHFIDLGEAAAVKELEALAPDHNWNIVGGIHWAERVGWVCRILFTPKGKEPLRAPRYGGHTLPDSTMPLASWPLYPVAASGTSYFVLSEGYSLGGRPEDPKAYLAYCRTKGTFRTQRVPVPTRAQALKDVEQLRQSKAWKAIKWSDRGPNFSYTLPESGTWDLLRGQAERVPAR